jgi:hypothetical protein
MLVPKKNPGGWRFICDLRIVNQRTVGMSYPLVNISDALSSLSGNTVFSVCDMSNAFHQIPLAPEDRPKTAFRCPFGSFQFKKMPQGLKNSSPIFQAFVDNVLGKLKWNKVINYIDDLIIYSQSIEQHFQDIKEVLTTIQKAGLHLKAEKCFLFRSRISFLGHVISAQGIEPDHNRVKCILEANPIKKKDIQSWLGLAGYYRKMIPQFASKAAPLYDLLKDKSKKHKSTLTEKEQDAINNIKQWLTTPPILGHPDFNKPFYLCTDASIEGLGCALQQKDNNGNDVVIQYASRALKPHEKKYHIYELEILALMWALEVHRSYLSHNKFTAITDNKAMLWLKTKKDSPNRRILNWVLRLEEFNFDIIHRTSKQHANADALSRLSHLSNVDYHIKHALTALALIPLPLEISEDETENVGSADFSDLISLQTTSNIASLTTQQGGSLTNESLVCAYTHDKEFELPDRSELIEAQKKDPALMAIRSTINTNKQPQNNTFPYFLNDDLLMRRTPTPTKFAKKVSKPFHFYNQICIPNDNKIQNAVLYTMHGLPISGHDGVKRTTLKTARHFYWPDMRKRIKMWVKSCLPCCKRKTARPNNHGLTQTVAAKYVNHMWAFDIVTDLPETISKGYNCILTCIDIYSKYLWAIPMTNRKIKSVVSALMSIGCDFGFPKLLLSDRERSFTSEVLKQLMIKLGTHKITTSGWQPQANPVERVHRWLNSTLTIFCNDHKNDWDEHLDPLLYAYRTCEHTTNKFTPFLLMFGREHRSIVDFLYNTTTTDTNRESKHNLFHTSTMHSIYKQVLKNQIKMAQLNKKYRDKNRIDITFQPNDSVLVYDVKEDTIGPKKFQFRWSGPSTIVKASPKSPLLYYVREASGNIRELHVNRLTLYNPHDDHMKHPDSWQNIASPRSHQKDPAQPPIQEGELVIVEYAKREVDTLPFALGQVLSIDNQNKTIRLWWLGNDHNNIFAAQRKGYYYKTTNRHYYSDSPRHPSHPRYTTVTTEQDIPMEHILFRNIELGIEQTIPFNLLLSISQNKNIPWTINRANHINNLQTANIHTS